MLAASASAVLAGSAAADPVVVPACQQAGPCVVVQVVAGDQVTSTSYFYADQVIGQADIENASYPVRGGTDAVVQPGSSLNRLAATALPDLGQVTYAEVVEETFGRHLLTAAEIGPADRAGFEGGLAPAFYSTSSDYFFYVRPQRDPDDANGTSGPDQGTFNSSSRGALLVRLHTTGQILDVGVTATPTDATRRSFALSTSPGGAGLSFDWRLPGGGRDTSATPTYAVPDNAVGGTFPITVGVERTSDGSFGWGRVDVQVGPPPTPPPSLSPSPTPGTGGDGPKDQGPTKAPSGSPDADPQPDPDPGSGGTPSAQPTDLPTLPEPSVPTYPTDGPGAPAPTDPVPTPTEPPVEPPPGTTVSGLLLTAAQVAADGAVVADAPQPSQAARPLVEEPLTIGARVWAVVAALLLLLAGAGSESPRVRRWARRRWSRITP